MKVINIIKNVFGGFFIFCSLIFLSQKDIAGYVNCSIFIALAILLLPSFNFICRLTNKDFSAGRKWALGLGTFFFPIMGVSTQETPVMDDLYTAIGVIVVYWIILFATNKKQYIDINANRILKESNKTDFISKFYNKRIQEHNKKVQAVMKYESEIKKSFTTLDVISTHAIAKMITETNERSKSVFNQDMPVLNISDIVMSICKDTQRFDSEYDFDNLFTKQYFINKANKDCSVLTNYIKNKIRASLNSQNKNNYLNLYNNYLNILFEQMPMFMNIKFYGAVSSTQAEELEKYKDYGVADSISYQYRDCLIYLIDLLVTCASISKLLFIERQVNKVNKENEFYKFIYNMTKEIKDNDVIITKSRPIYDEFYKSSLGFISDDLNYGIAVTIIANRINEKEFSKKDESILDINDDKALNFDEYNYIMNNWIRVVADKYRNLDIDRYIIFKAINSIDLNNFDLYFKALAKVNDYSRIYYYNVEHNNKVTDKDRYLNGDFEKEKKELSGKYSLNNITTGTQFELYLVNLFKDLGYKVKHNGKAGDQGCDLIVKKDDYIYAIQAKYYTGKLSNTPVQEIAGSLKYYNANQGVVVTNSSFTPGAEELAKANNVILIDGKDLKKLINYTFEEEHEEDVLKNFEK